MAKKSKKRGRLSEPNADNVERTFDFRKFYASNVYCAVTPFDFRVELLNEKIEYEDGWWYISDAMTILTPRAAKRLHEFLGKALKSYEAEHGVIETKATNEAPY